MVTYVAQVVRVTQQWSLLTYRLRLVLVYIMADKVRLCLARIHTHTCAVFQWVVKYTRGVRLRSQSWSNHSSGSGAEEVG